MKLDLIRFSCQLRTFALNGLIDNFIANNIMVHTEGQYSASGRENTY